MTELPPAKLSSTVILAAATNAAPEFLMVERNRASSFGGAWVFPGGVLEEDDERAALEFGTLAADEANRRLGLEGGGLAYYSAAIRELFEETGILLAPSVADDPVRLRNALLDGSIGWFDALSRNRLRLDIESLHYVSFWITPRSLPKRYSTRFFVAAYDAATDAVPCGGEVLDCRWASARNALAAADRGEIELHFPTRITLETLAEFDSIDALLDWAQRQADAGVRCIFPSLPEEDAVLDAVKDGDD